MAAAAMLKNRKKCHISTVVRLTLTKFGITTQFNLDSSDRQKFKILKINYRGGRHFENGKIAISPRRLSNFDEIWHDNAVPFS